MSSNQNKASGYGGGGKSGGRGTGNRKFVYKSNANVEKGLIEELPLLKYSPKVEDQMAVKFINWKEKLFQYVQNSSNYSPKVAKIFKGQAVAEEVRPPPPQPDPDAPQRILRGAVVAPEPEWWQKEEWKDQCKRVSDSNAKLRDDKLKIYALILGQCAESMRQKLSAQQDWAAVSQAEDPVALLGLINQVCMTPGAHSAQERIHAAMQGYHTLKQSKYESLGDYRKRFDAAVQTMVQSGLQQNQLPDDEAMAVAFIKALDRNRFGQFIVDWMNGLLPNLTSVDLVQARAETHVTLQAHLHERQTQIFLCNEVPRTSSKKSSKKGDNKGTKNTPTNTESGSGGDSKKAKGKRPSAENPCWRCGAHDHFSRDCPDAKDASAQEVVRGTNLVSMVSLVIPHDTLDIDDSLTFVNEDISLSESSVMLSLNSDNDSAVETVKVTVNANIAAAAKSLPQDYILLDTCGGANLFSNPNLLSNSRKSTYGLIIDGIRADSKPVITFREGDTCFGSAHYSPDSRGNILSFGVTRDRCYHMWYDFDEDRHYLRMYREGDVYMFVRWENIYIHDTKDSTHVLSPAAPLCTSTVHQNAAKYTRREVKDAAAAREMMRKLADPSPASMAERLRGGRIANTTLTPSDVWRSIDIWGKSLETIKGKTTSHQAPVVKSERLPVDDVQRDQELQVDLMFVDKVAFLLGVLIPMKYILLSPLVNKTKEVIWKSLRKFILIPRSRNIQVRIVRTDPESAVAALDTDIAELGCQLNPGGKGEAIPVVERTIRTIKERCRGILNTLHYTLPYCLIAALCIFVVQRLNMFPSSTNYTVYSPRELLWNRVINAKTDLALGFGDYVQAHRNEEDNSMSPRTDGAIALYPIGNLEGTWAFYNLNTNRVVKRNRWTEVPLDQRVIEHMNTMSLNQKRKLPQDIVFRRGINVLDDEDIQYIVEVPHHEQENMNPIMIRRAEDVIQDIPVEYDVNEVLQDVDTRTTPLHQEEVVPIDIPAATPPEVIISADDEVILPQSNDQSGRYSLRPNRAQPGRWSGLLADSKRVFGLQYSTKAAVKKFGSKAYDAMFKEMSQIIDMKTIRPVELRSLTSRQRSKIIRSHMFFKEKFYPNGDFEKLKARFVAGGDGQDRSMYSENQISSQTVSTSSVFVIAALAAREKRAVATVDFPGAYLNSDMPSDGEKVFMRMDPYMTSVLCKVSPEYKQYVNQDGTAVVQVVKGLYGLIEAAKLWFDKLTGLLKTIGFKSNPYDPCVLNRLDSNGDQTTLAIHVDDVLITASTEEAIDQLLVELESFYPGLSISRGKELNYLGMIFKFKDDGKCVVSMEGFVEDLLSSCDIAGTCGTPATSTLFSINENSPCLSVQDKVTFHSLTAKLLYFAKRIRPDLLTVVSFLTTRVQKPTLEDWSKLVRAIKYIRHTKHLVLTLCADKYLLIMIFTDASFGVHHDMRSHTGAAITLFKGVIWAKSSKQKIMTKSSTEAELVAISDVIGQVLWLRNFLEAQGYVLPPVKLFEDNLSTIALIKSGKSNSSRTRHIAIRYFFISDKVLSKEVEVEFMPTDSMLADILTKPLQGSLFKKFRDLLLNVE